MRSSILAPCLCMFTIACCAQNFRIEKLEESNPHSPDDIYTFPILHGPNDKAVQRINAYLIEDFLDIKEGQQHRSIFENVWKKPDDVIARINYLSYQLELLNSNIYSVTISGEFCSAYCEGFDVTYTFDLESGAHLSLDTLLNENGKAKLLSELTSHKKTTIAKKLQEIEKELQSGLLSPDDREYLEMARDLYSNCTTEYDELAHFRFIPSADSLKIIYDRCSAHFNRAVDELGDFEKSLSIKEWRAQLSPLGLGTLRN